MAKRKLKTVGNRIKTSAGTDRIRRISTTERRMTGSALQRRRERIWLERPTCAVCKRLTEFPRGFELDHIVPLWQDGEDADDNCQVLCVWYDDEGNKRGCHASKTAEEAGRR